MTFNEANTVEAFIRDLLCGGVTITPPSVPAWLGTTTNSPDSAGTISPP